MPLTHKNKQATAPFGILKIPEIKTHGFCDRFAGTVHDLPLPLLVPSEKFLLEGEGLGTGKNRIDGQAGHLWISMTIEEATSFR